MHMVYTECNNNNKKTESMKTNWAYIPFDEKKEQKPHNKNISALHLIS